MADDHEAPAFVGDAAAAAGSKVLGDRRELALVAFERTRMPMVITDPRRPDNPIVLANAAFLELTGYTSDEVLGRNCRFLQGPATAPGHVDEIRQRLRDGKDHISVELLNYRKDGSSFWNQLAISAVHGGDGELLYYFASQKDVSRRREAQKLEASERLLLKEIDHRAMNALALVQSVVSLSRTDSVERFAASIKGRVDAIARAHRLLAKARWSAAELGELVTMEAGTSRVAISGPAVLLPPRLVQPLCLVLHELIANAREHGALSRAGGYVGISWEAAPDHLSLRWSERGVATVLKQPEGAGLGLSLVRSTIQQQLGGSFSVTWLEDGLDAELAIPWTI